MLGVPGCRRLRIVSYVGLLGAEVCRRVGHLPELEPAGIADLVELQVRAVTRVAAMTTPDLRGGLRIAHQHVDRASARRVADPIALIG